MLRPHEFLVGTAAEAKPLSLFYLRGPLRMTYLVGGTALDPLYVCIDEGAHFHVLRAADAEYLSGVIVPGVEIEIDPEYILDRDAVDPGLLVRTGRSLAVLSGGPPPHHWIRTALLMDDMPAAESTETAKFARWRIVLGEGVSKRVLWGCPNCE